MKVARGPNRQPYTSRSPIPTDPIARKEREAEQRKRYRTRNRERVLARGREHDRARAARRSEQRKSARLANREAVLAREHLYRLRTRDIRSRQAKLRRQKDPVKAKLMAASKRAMYREQAKVSTALWRSRNPDRVKAMDVRRRAKRLANPELLAKKRQEYRRYYYANREKILPKISVYVRVRQARLKGAEGRCTPIEWRERYDLYDGCCAYCSKPLPFRSATIDHVMPISKGGSNWPSNLVPACATCNKSKGNRLWTPRQPGQESPQLKSSGAVSESG